jgi:hypothetical protein
MWTADAGAGEAMGSISFSSHNIQRTQNCSAEVSQKSQENAEKIK